jgi:expansin (peptidoglycan-binding protein)
MASSSTLKVTNNGTRCCLIEERATLPILPHRALFAAFCIRSNEAASSNLPLGSEATVTDKNTGKSTDVKVTDRGPTRRDRVIDLSKKSANDVGMEKQGTAPVTVQPK